MKSSWLAILTALIAQQILGFCWYSRALFAEAWAAGIGKRVEDLQPSAGPFVLATIAALLLPLGIAWLLHRAHLHGIKAGALVGFGCGAFFIAPAVLMHEAFLGYPSVVLAIDGAKEVVGAFLVGAILGTWPRRSGG